MNKPHEAPITEGESKKPLRRRKQWRAAMAARRKKIVVGEGTSVSPPASLGRKRVAIGGAAVCVAIVIGIAGYVGYRKSHSVKTSNVCDNAITKSANEQYKMGSINAMANITQQIKYRRAYLDDPNCLYIIVQYNILTGNTHGADVAFDRIRTHYQSFQFSKNLDDGHASISNLQKQLDLMRRLKDNANGSIDPNI